MAKAMHPRYKHINRPRKHGAAKTRRTKEHRKRLVALGLPADKVQRMTTLQLRTLLKRPKQLVKKLQKQKK